MLTDEQLIEVTRPQGMDDPCPDDVRAEILPILRRVEAAVRADFIAQLRTMAAEWRDGHGDFGIGEAQTLEITACALEGSDHDEWDAKRAKHGRRRAKPEPKQAHILGARPKDSQ